MSQHTTPRISVIMPVHNAERYLEQCLDSVIAQTEKDIEIICVNDGSTDSSPQILRSYADSDNRISIINQEQKGAGAARNKGLEQAKAKYLSFLDADDFFELDMLKTAADRADQTNADVLVFGAWTFDMTKNADRAGGGFLNSNNVPDKEVFSADDMPDKIFNTFGSVIWNKLYKRSFILENKLRYMETSRGNDVFFAQSSVVVAKRIAVIDRCFVHYRVDRTPGNNSLQSTYDKNPTSFTATYEQLKEFLLSHGIYEKLEKSLLNLVLDGILHAVNSVRSLDSLAKIQEAVLQKVEPSLGILKLPNESYYHENSIVQYRDLCSCELGEFLLKRCLNLRSQIEDAGWYIDWLEWKIWQYENEANESQPDNETQPDKETKGGISALKSLLHKVRR